MLVVVHAQSSFHGYGLSGGQWTVFSVHILDLSQIKGGLESKI